jgi:hypothetical protein
MKQLIKSKTWLRDFNAEFLRRTGITWSDAGGADRDSLDQYYPQDVSESVSHHIWKYELNDITL